MGGQLAILLDHSAATCRLVHAGIPWDMRPATFVLWQSHVEWGVPRGVLALLHGEYSTAGREPQSSGVVGAMLGGALNKAHLALDVRVIDISTSEILAATLVEGQASDISGAIMAGFLEGWDLGSGLSAYANTPMEKAIRICIIEAVKYIAQTPPADYYKY